MRERTLIIKDIPEKAANSFSIGLLSNKRFNFVQYDHDYGTNDMILPLMLENIKEYQSEKLLDISRENIKTAKFTTLGHFLSFVKDNKLTETSDVILNRLQQKNQAYEIFHLTETVLTFHHPDNKAKIVNALRANQADWDWGNWSKSFRNLFERYDIKFD